MNLKKWIYNVALIMSVALSTGLPVWASYIVPDGSVTTAKLATGAVTQAKLAARATGSTVAAGGVAFSSGSGAFSGGITSSFSTVTGMSVTITTTGRPVKIIVQATPGTSDSTVQCDSNGSSVYMGIFRAGSVIAAYRKDLTVGIWNTLSEASLLDNVAAGTYTYDFRLKSSFATSTCTVTDYQLVAYEI